ncbi:MAG: 3-isopropylmalate dehydratase [Bacteroidetes bacterium]|nr:3-isopropylmalate dehydratase [Bacteroidota bacterium]
MNITDRNGLVIIVTDLPQAIEQAALFKDLEHVNATPEQQQADAERKAYWSDIHQQLLQLKKQQP